MASETSMIVQSNYWHRPGIEISYVHVDKENPQGGIKVAIKEKDFIKAILQELDHPAKIWTRAALDAAVQGAVLRVLEKAKEATNAVAL